MSTRAGTVIVPPTARARMVLDETAKATGIAVQAVDTTPEVAGFKLKPGTRIGLIRGANNMPGGWLMWLFEHFGMEYETVKAADYDKLDALYDTIVLAPGVNRARIVSGLDMTRYPEEFAWAGGVGEAGWSKLAAFVTGGGTLLGLGSASETAQQLLNLPIQRVATTQPFSIGGSLLRETFDPTVPAAWGLPAEGSTYFNGDRAWNVSDPTAKDRRRLPGHGHDARVGLRGRRRAAARQGRHRHAQGGAGQRSRSSARRRRSARGRARCGRWSANSVYHGPSAAVSAVDIKTLSAAAVAQESGEQPQPEAPARRRSRRRTSRPTARAPAERAATPAPAAAPRVPWPARRGRR